MTQLRPFKGRFTLQIAQQSLSAVIIAAGIIVLAGWGLDFPLLTGLAPGLTPMNPGTAAAFICAALSLWLIQGDLLLNRQRQLLALLTAAVVGLFGTTRLVAYICGYDLGLDQLLFASRLRGNVIAPNTAFGLTISSAALLLLIKGNRRATVVAQNLAAIVWIMSLFSVVGYAYGAKQLYGLASYIPMALNTSITFQILATALFFARPDHGPMKALTSNAAGAVMARRLIPSAVAIPIVMGWLRLAGQDAGWYGTEFGASLMAVISIVVFVGLIVWTAMVLNQIDYERLRAQQDILRLNEDLERRVEARTQELAAANRDLAEKNQENETFVYSVSHDLRSPLVNLQGFSNELTLVCQDVRQIVLNCPPSERDRGLKLIDQEMAQSVHFIQTAVKRLSSIIDALLRLSRAGRLQYQPQEVNVADTVTRVVETLHGTITQRRAQVIVKRLPPAWCDPTALEQIFANLIGNAINYLDPARPGIVEIGSCASEVVEKENVTDCCAYYVRDNGLGIPDAYLAKVFQAFQRLHADRAPGEGMGLSIVRRMVERHGGRIWLTSRVGEGTTFYISLPCGQLPNKKRPLQNRVAFPINDKEFHRDTPNAYHPAC